MASTHAENIALKIYLARKTKNWTQTELAHRAGISRDTVARIEAGDIASVAYGTIRHILAILGFNLAVEYAPTVIRESHTTFDDHDVQQWILHDYHPQGA